MKKIIVLSGAGISQESGIQTFRGEDGLWEGHRVEDVATPEAWMSNPNLVMEFYNQRRKNVLQALPNKAHRALVQLESSYDVHIITQNVDDLHERAGSKQVLHLHGLIRQARSVQSGEVYDIEGSELNLGDLCPRGAQLRPHIVWFGEDVPMIEPAIEIISLADIVIVVGTSLLVYPAASLLNYAPSEAPIYLVDPDTPIEHPRVKHIREKATYGMQSVLQELQNVNGLQ